MSRLKRVKIYGMKRTGTNWLTIVIRQNFCPCLVNGPTGWKHGLSARGMPDDCVGLVVAKHPLSWLVSMYRYDGTWNHFGNWIRKETAIAAWNYSGGYWLQMREKLPGRIAIVRFEDAMGNVEKTLSATLEPFGIRRAAPDDPFRTTENYVRPGEKVGKRAFRAGWYRRQTFLEYYSSELLDFVRERLDVGVLDALGYEVSNGEI